MVKRWDPSFGRRPVKRIKRAMADHIGIITATSSVTGEYQARSLHAACPGIEEFAILEFAPNATRKTWRFATNGMSAYAQPREDDPAVVRTELFACARSRETWIADLLAAIATYPKDYATHLAEGDSIDVGQPVDRRHSPYIGVLLAPPGPFDPATIGLVGGCSEKILVHQVVGQPNLHVLRLVVASQFGSVW